MMEENGEKEKEELLLERLSVPIKGMVGPKL